MQTLQPALFCKGAPSAKLLGTLLLALMLVAGCMPIQPTLEQPPLAPETQTVPPAASETEAEIETETEAEDPFAGDWSGAIAVATIELPFDLHLTPGAEGYSATLDIPMQGAIGLPVQIVSLTPESVEFTILEGAQLATFAGALDADGAISGVFLQAGQEGTFTLTRTSATASDTSATSATGGIDRVYTHPSELWSVPVPTGWTVVENEQFVTLNDPDAEIAIHLLALPGEDPADALTQAWEIVLPGFDLEIDQELSPPSGEGVEAILVRTYNTGDDMRIVQAAAQQFDGITYVSLFDLGLLSAQRRSSQISIIDAGFKILGIEKTDLSNTEPAPLSDEIVATWETFIESALAKFEVPGAIIGVVRGGELVYAEGFGYADPELQTPMTPDTHMMIGSTGKSLSTMLMGILVDEGIMTWDTPAHELYADFRVMDPELSETITMRNLVCACTGVPRRDFEFLFNADLLTASDVIASLQTFEFFTDFGEAFQYSNQMVATGGYIAGLAAEPEVDEPFAAYVQALDDRVTGPLGMDATTLSFDEVVAAENFATPHSYNALGEYVQIPLDVEKTLLPIAPAGSHWSTLSDMSKYMIAQLSTGVAPSGERVISEENLLVTREPQVSISAEISYGLGWMIGDYRGQPMIEHAGNTLGFTSDFAFLPNADLGVIVLTNAQNTNTFSTAARIRLLELLFDLPSQVEPSVDFSVARMEEQLGELRGRLSGVVDEATVVPFVGFYSNPVLGDLEVTFVDGELFADFGEFVSRISPITDAEGQPDDYVLFDAPLAGFPLRLEMDEAGLPNVIIGGGVTEYTFTPAE